MNPSFLYAAFSRRGLAALLLAAALPAAMATTSLADQPVFASKDVPGNLALALSVEFPTAVSVAHTNNTYSSTTRYLGYFDPARCYLYDAAHATPHFYVGGATTSNTVFTCTGTNDTMWSGNFLNWASMQTIDPFRWALTGGYRAVDTATETILEKARASGQGGTGNFPDRTLSNNTDIAGATPFTWGSFKMRIQGLGAMMRFTNTGNVNSGTPTGYTQGMTTVNSTVYVVAIRTKVCDASAPGGVESFCTAYPAGNYKPTGLLQQYADKFRYSAFGYLNDDSIQRDGGVLRAKQKFIGPTRPVPTSVPVSNGSDSEWDENNGVLYVNPNASDATATNTLFGLTTNPVTNSGVINYLNKFGKTVANANYKTYDPVSELYYAALRYYRKLGNVPEWAATGSASEATKTIWADGFPVITNWDDPVQYTCQKNFVLGIGDVNTHADKNLPGSSTPTGNEPGKPASVSSDPWDSVAATNKIGALHGLGSTLGTTNPYNGCCNNNSALMAGLAYLANTQDIRADLSDTQTVQTYWLDILEYQTYKSNNQYYLAAKYGGFKVPNGWNTYGTTTDPAQNTWSTTGETVGSQARPDNYFVANNPASMVAGLQRAFSKLASDLQLYSTSFSIALPQLTVSGAKSYAGKFDAANWTGEIEANALSFDSNNNPIQTTQWSFSTKLAAQLAGTGWNTNRVMMTWNPSTAAGVPFRWTDLASTQQSALDTIYRSSADGTDFLNYLRGDTTYEENSSASVAATDKVYRTRTSMVGDIVGSRVLAVPPPASAFSDAKNPGYLAFKTQWNTTTPRPTMLYVGTNAGVLHAVNGDLTGSNAGKEVFAFVPNAMFSGPTSTPSVNGLVARGDPNFTHKPMLDGPVAVYDIDINRTGGVTSPTTNAWRTVLIGSMGKGGKGYFAIDVTDPMGITSETIAASKVMWEINQSQAGFGDLGYTFGEPVVVKTAKYGWVVIFASGYNNSNGNAYFFIVNPRTGALHEKVQVPVSGSSGSQLGMAHLEAFVNDYTDGTADAVYAGDLKGNVYRLEMNTNTFTVTHLAEMTNAANEALPITTPPAVLYHPLVKRRFIALGTGRLLDSSDISDSRSHVFAAFMDGNNAGFNTPYSSLTPNKANMLPQAIGGFPLQRSELAFHTDVRLKVSINPTTQIGWWIDLGLTSGNGWRVIRDPSAYEGIVTFAATLPAPDACNPSGKSRIYSVDVAFGQSELIKTVTTNVNGVPTTTTELIQYNDKLGGEIISTQSVSVDGKRVLIGGSNTGGTGKIETAAPSAPGLRRLNWRELQLAD
jgi:type IV pilus assembly protein PilY1